MVEDDWRKVLATKPSGRIIDREVRRREFVATNSVLGAALIAGCLGDDEVDPDDLNDDDVDDTDDQDDVVIDDTDDTDDTDDVDDVDDEDEVIERYDVTAVHVRSPPIPADATYAHGWVGEALADWVNGNRHQYSLAERSFGDFQVYSHLLEDISYSPGLLELTFRDDIYWWSGKRMDAEDLTTFMDLADWVHGGEDLDNYPNIIARDQIADDAVRMSLADTWRRDWALQNAIVDFRLESSVDFHQPWIDQFEDTGGDMDAVSEVRDDFADQRIDSDDELVHHFHVPFEFRLDGTYGEVGEDYWHLELVPEKNGNERGWADLINFTGLRFYALEESGIRRDEAFLAGDEPMTGFGITEDEEDIPFPFKILTFVREFDQWGWNMNVEAHPTDNPHFRRAWTFATRVNDWEEPVRAPTELVGHPFLEDQRVHQWVSDEVVEDFTAYGVDAEWDRAEDELDIGGFERNGDGFYLNQEEGAPIDITVGGHSWMSYVGDFGSDWFTDMSDFGIQVEFVPERGPDDPWRVESDYIGGLLPERVFDTLFGESDLAWTAWNPGFPESVSAPAVGDTDADPDDWIEYDTRATADRLAVTVDDAAYQAAVDNLAWVANQLVPRVLVATQTQMRAVNDYHWHVLEAEEAPERFLRLPEDRMWYNGLLSWVPEDER